jgi:hypothetical protein
MNTDASIVDSFLSAAESKAEDAKRRRDEKLKAAHGSHFAEYERELRPVLEALAALPPRTGDVLTVRFAPESLSFSIEQLTDTREGPAREILKYEFSGGAEGGGVHRIGFRQETKTRYGNTSPDARPETFEAVRDLLAAWIAEKIPHRLSELRAIARNMNDGDMQLSRNIKTAGPLKLKAGQA